MQPAEGYAFYNLDDGGEVPHLEKLSFEGRNEFLKLSEKDLLELLNKRADEFGISQELIGIIAKNELRGEDLAALSSDELQAMLGKVGWVRRINHAVSTLKAEMEVGKGNSTNAPTIESSAVNTSSSSTTTTARDEQKVTMKRLHQRRQSTKLLYTAEEVKIGRVLGTGNFGQAVEGTLPCGTKVAVKIPNGKVDDEEVQKELLNFMQIGRGHRNLLQFLGMVSLQGKPCLMSELCKGSLDRLHKEIDMTKPDRFLRIVTDVCSGLAHLHSRNIIHRDIACRNLLMKSDGTVLISDYGLSRFLGSNDFYSGSHSAWAWMAPESFGSKGAYTKKSDVWMAGVTFWEIMTRGRTPYGNENPREVVLRIICGTEKLPIPEIAKLDLYARGLIESCLQHDPDDRPEFKHLLARLSAAEKFRQISCDLRAVVATYGGFKAAIEELGGFDGLIAVTGDCATLLKEAGGITGLVSIAGGGEAFLDAVGGIKALASLGSFLESTHVVEEKFRKELAMETLESGYALQWGHDSRGQNRAKGSQLVTLAMKMGSVGAKGICYLSGVGGKKRNLETAMTYLKQAANAGCRVAKNELGLCFKQGKGVKQDFAMARNFFEKASARGLGDATFNLGVLYESGAGVPKNMTKAFELYQNAAGSGHVSAILALAHCYENGIGVCSDRKKAFALQNQIAQRNGIGTIGYDVKTKFTSPLSLPSLESAPSSNREQDPSVIASIHYTSEKEWKGIFHYLGTKCGTDQWMDPVVRGYAECSSSSCGYGTPAKLLQRFKHSRFHTKNDRNSWVSVTLKQGYSIIVEAYTIRHGDGYSSMSLRRPRRVRNWRLEGSNNDGEDWKTLRSHENDPGINKSWGHHTWPVQGIQESFRKFRVVQTGKNSLGDYELTIGGIEFYGKLCRDASDARK